MNIHSEEKMRRDLAISPTDHQMVETTSSKAEENPSLPGGNFEDIRNKLENRMSERLRDREDSQREDLGLMKNLSSKVDNLSNPSLEQGCSHSRLGTPEGSSDTSITKNDVSNGTRNAVLNMLTGVITSPP